MEAKMRGKKGPTTYICFIYSLKHLHIYFFIHFHSPYIVGEGTYLNKLETWWEIFETKFKAMDEQASQRLSLTSAFPSE